MKVFVQRDGAQQGPFTVEDVQRLLGSGELLGSDLGWIEGTEEGWKRLDQLKMVSAPPPVLTGAAVVGAMPGPPPATPPVPATGSKAGMWWAAGVGTAMVLLIVGLIIYQASTARAHKAAVQFMHQQLQGSWDTPDPNWNVSLRFDENWLEVNYRGQKFKGPFRIDGVQEERVTVVFPIFIGAEYRLEFNGPDHFTVEESEEGVLEVDFIPGGEYHRE